MFPPVAFFDEAPVDGESSGESGSSGDGSDVTAPNEGAPDNNTSNGENSNEGAPDKNASGEESLEGNASDEVSDAEQDAAQIEGAEVLQQGDGETIGNVLVADRAAVDALGGRDFAGQVVKEINGTKYILIGNEQQLRAIGSGKRVYTPVYQAIYHAFKGWEVDKDENGEPIMLYGGDADLLALQNGKKDFTFGEIDEADGGALETVGRCGVNQETGEINSNMDIEDSGATYSVDANYIIFRDIDLSAGGNWEPLMFSSTMLGAKSDTPDAAGSLWKCIKEDGSGIVDVTAVANPVISNVIVVQSDAKLDVSKYTGIGFFGTISNKIDERDPFAVPTKATVSNITLEKVSVENHATEVRVDQSLISGLLGVLGVVVGGVLSTLLEILTLGKLSLNGLIENLLNVRAADPSSLATGAFAGRVVGDVEVSGCEVHEASVSSVAQMNGGFVGCAQGDTVYSILSEALDDIVKLLTNILNIIPGLGLGDLITLLLDSNIIKAGELLPVDYLNPMISHCSVHNFAEGEVIGSADNDYAGGFAGVMVGTVAQECSVESANPYTVKGRLYAGGFAGLMRNDVMKGALSEVGVELVRVAQPQSAAAGCAVRSGVTVTAASYAGGFAGAMANSYAVDASVEGAANISATGHEEEHDGKRSIKALAGGFTGAATVGWATDLGQGENKNSDLLAGVNGLLTGLLTSDPEAAQNLLSLVGVEESKLLGVQMKGEFTVHSANDFAGGMVGRGDGAVIAASDDLHVSDIKLWSQGTVSYAASGMGCSIEGLRSVSADGSYAGGIAGGLGTASVGGVLNTTIGLGGYLPFNVSSTTVSGVADGFTVTAGDSCAAGGIGKATGGKIGRADDAYESAAVAPTTSVVNISNIKSVTAKNNAGGFAGLVGPGDLASTGGLDLLGLGALKLNGLLSVADGLEVKMDGVTVAGVPAGMTVESTGNNDADGGTTRFAAAGFIASANSAEVTDGHVKNLASVTAHLEDGIAGGFVGVSRTGGLADVADEAAIKGLLSVNNLLNAVGYMIPSYTNVDVSYINGGTVSADMAGGFTGDFQSGTVENPEGNPWAVYNIAQVTGGSYAGGFGGKVTSGALAAADGGVSILGGIADLSIGVEELLGVMGAYVPSIKNAGVKSDASTVEATSGVAAPDEKNPGLIVTSTRMDMLDSQSGSAGGYIGYGSGVQVSNCDVTQLRHTGVVEPAELEGADGSSYFNGQSAYAVKAPRYAGGYMGKIDIGSAASVGKGLNVLGQAIKLTDIAGALSVVVSTVEHSDVNGGTGGFAVLATEASLPEGDLGDGSADPGSAANPVGSAGGFVGEVKGGHIQDSNSYNFSYIVGQVKAGGYAGGIAPGDVASVLADNTSILKGLIGTNGTLASLVQDFVPTIRNSETTCVPCGGAVRAQAASGKLALRGMAGGYVGHNEGGHIWGNNNASWKKENDGSNHYTGTQRMASAERIRSVYGAEFAGGFTGLLEPADTASTGNLSLLFGLVEVNNLLGALEVTYPTQENTEVTGPLRGMPFESWNAWAEHVGSQGGYGPQIGDAANNVFGSQEEFDNFVASYIYGTNVVAGRTAHSTEANASRGGIAGGYVGLMHGGVITHGQATDTKTVSALRAAGGFAGSMETADAASLGSVDLLNLVSLNLDSLVSALDVLVPVVKSSSVTGYRKGMTVTATGTDTKLEQGFAGGYVGYASGAQIWGDATFADADKDGDRWTTGATHEGAVATGCNVENLRKVSGANCIGGYAGIITAAGVADVNTNGASSGLLQKLLDTLIETPSSVASVLNATVSTVRGASVSAVDEAADAAAGAWGFTIEGAYGNADARKYARAAGGFAGSAKAVVVGSKEGGTSGLDTVSVNGLHGVEGGQYAGGFVGQADVTGVASVAGSTEGDQSTNLLLGLIKAGNIAAVDAFRPYFYHANVDGVADGFQVRAYDSSTQGILSSKQFTGTAGGFAGSVVNGSVKDCAVTDLMSVSGVNYTGGFVGHLGKAGTVDVDNAQFSSLLGATAGVLDVWGAHVERSTVTGVADGYIATSTHNGADYGLGTDAASGREVAGGFVGYADLARVKDCDAGNLKLVTSGEVAGGFAGEALRAHLVEAEVSSPLLDLVLFIVNALLKVLYIPGLEDLGLINLGDWLGIGKIFDLKVLADGDAVYVNLFGLKIGVSLSKASSENQQETDVAIITIGDSTIKLPCTEAGITDTENARSNLTVELIKGNRARVEGCSVTGVVSGYDVFGGGASQNADGAADRATGYAGGFSGLNDEGVLYHNDMYYADVVRGTAEKVDPFANIKLKSVWDFNNMEDIVGADDAGNYNVYRIYRPHIDGATNAVVRNGVGGRETLASAVLDEGAGTLNTALDRYDVDFFELVNCYDQNVASSGAAGDDDTKWVGVKDAIRLGAAGTGFQEPLGVYASPAKAVLMLDAAQTGNGGALTPEPDEGQDPCEARVDVTIQKIWNDAGDKEGLRPDAIRVQLVGSYTNDAGEKIVPNGLIVQDGNGATTETIANPQQVDLTEADNASGWTETWRRVVAGLPVAFADENGAIHYYTYEATEVQVLVDGAWKSLEEAGYTVTYRVDGTDRVIEITNTHLPMLPETGGSGLWMLILLALALLGGGALWRKRRSMIAAQEAAFAQSLGMQPVGSFAASPVKPAGAHARQPERASLFNLPRM
ncbi:Cna B-type domain-containing protein [Slackia sp.]|uniref:Cna B-type domain-containing protein n=1 Tax=Slackia sp. TaxID=2049041 RepID=UPI002E76CB81|nr:Cna B-type domain-containing protein [Slackia sp.]MEE0518039.1 Cna B-type domain-containing protein [Slackia sp.]